MAVLLGNQFPTYHWAPEYDTSSGIDAVQFSAANGLVLDPWQANILHDGLAETPDGKWLNNEVGVIVGRQNGKGSIIEARTLAGLFVFGERLILHSAHQQKTSNDAFNRLLTIVQSNPDLDRRVVAISRSKGEEGITFRIDGRQHRVRYMTRTGSAGRGLTKADLIFLDEAMILDEGPIAALLPTMATMPNWQVFYTASAGDRRLPTGSRVLARVRRRGMAKEPGVVLHMWEAHLKHSKDTCPAGCTLDKRNDPQTWAKTNPTFNVVRPDGTQGITGEFLGKMIRAMASWDFDREHLGVGDYPQDEGWNVFSGDLWNAMQATDDELRDIQLEGAPRPFTVGIESTWDGSSTAVNIAAMRPDGKWHWETLKVAAGITWVIDYCVALNAKKPTGFAIDPKGPSAQIIPDLQNATRADGRPAKLNLFLPTLPQFIAASAKVLSTVMETQAAVHLGQDALTDAVRLVEKRELGQGQFAWQRIDTAGDVSPIIGITMAVAGHVTMGGKKRGRPLVGAA